MAEARFQKIIDDGLCIGCGICETIAGSDTIEMTRTPDYELRPKVKKALNPDLVDKIYDICPGTRIDGLPPGETKEALHHDPIWGPYMDMVLAWAGNPNVRFEGATAGVLTALGQYLLASGQVSFIYHVGNHPDDPTFGAGKISRTEAEVLEGAGSRYGPTAMLSHIDDVLALGQDFAVIGKPCDLAALRNLARHDKRVNQYVKSWLTPVCGGYLPGLAMGDFLQKEDINRAELAGFRYRGLGCPGPSTASFKNGTQRHWHYLDFWGEDESAWSLPFRCKICPDGIGECADIAAADTWPNASPDRETSLTDPGTNSLIIRSWAGMALISGALQAGYLKVGRAVAPDYLSRTQPHQVTKKMTMAARYEGLTKAGNLAPQTNRLRLKELSDELSPENYKAQRDGAFKRALKPIPHSL